MKGSLCVVQARLCQYGSFAYLIRDGREPRLYVGVSRYSILRLFRWLRAQSPRRTLVMKDNRLYESVSLDSPAVGGCLPYEVKAVSLMLDQLDVEIAINQIRKWGFEARREIRTVV